MLRDGGRRAGGVCLGRADRGVTLLEVIIAMVVLTIAIVCTLSMLVVVQGHNESVDDARVAHKACQKMLENLLSKGYDQMRTYDQWTFTEDRLIPGRQIGLVEINTPDPPNDPAKLVEIVVSLRTTETLRPVDVSLRAWRYNE